MQMRVVYEHARDDNDDINNKRCTKLGTIKGRWEVIVMMFLQMSNTQLNVQGRDANFQKIPSVAL